MNGSLRWFSGCLSDAGRVANLKHRTLSTPGTLHLFWLDEKLINVITGLDAGTQLIIPGGFINDNLVLSYKPAPC